MGKRPAGLLKEAMAVVIVLGDAVTIKTGRAYRQKERRRARRIENSRLEVSVKNGTTEEESSVFEKKDDRPEQPRRQA
jgi:hypothetical protein